ncbi:MAG: PAS domain S-box protein [Methanomassiliicoccus sp.]|nr:PAS domain S-box protein [Methanomassiliicoccus sp.]
MTMGSWTVESLLNASSTGISVVDRQGTILYANIAIADLLDLRQEDIVGKKIIELGLDPDGMALLDLAMKKIVSTGTSIKQSLWSPTASRYLQFEGSPVFGKGGEVEASIAVVVDITELKRTQDALADSEKMLRLASEAVNMFMWEADLVKRTYKLSVDAEKVVCFSLPISLDEAWKMIHPEDRAMFNAAVGRAIEDLSDFEVEYRLAEHPPGEETWVRSVGRVYADMQGRATHILGITRNITERRSADRRAEEEHARLQAIMDNIPVAVGITDREGRMIIDNGMLFHIWGGMEDEGDRYEDRAWCTTTGMKLTKEDWPTARALRGERNTATVDIEKYNGGRGAVIMSAIPLRDEEGGITGSVWVMQDITDLRKLELDLKRSNSELQEFAYIASHDLQEPLRMVTSYLELISRRLDGVLDERTRQYMAFAIDGSRRMKDMIDDLLTYSRVDTKAKEFSPVDMNDVLLTSLHDLKVCIKESGASITSDPLPTIIADRQQSVLLLDHLIGNAIKYRDLDPPRVHVSSASDGREWTFSVSDNGIGIDPKYQDRLFKMFQRLHSHDEYEGTGMGLATAKKIVERHGGRIWFEAGDQGTTFFFTIPDRGVS